MRARWFGFASAAALLLAAAAPRPGGDVDLYFHDFYVVLAAAPLLLVLAALLAGLALLYGWIGHRLARAAALVHFWLTILGAVEMAAVVWRPRQLSELGRALAFFAGTLILAGAQILLLVAVVWALARGTRARG